VEGVVGDDHQALDAGGEVAQSVGQQDVVETGGGRRFGAVAILEEAGEQADRGPQGDPVAAQAIGTAAGACGDEQPGAASEGSEDVLVRRDLE
jgi:hypothetical protein